MVCQKNTVCSLLRASGRLERVASRHTCFSAALILKLKGLTTHFCFSPPTKIRRSSLMRHYMRTIQHAEETSKKVLPVEIKYCMELFSVCHKRMQGVNCPVFYCFPFLLEIRAETWTPLPHIGFFISNRPADNIGQSNSTLEINQTYFCHQWKQARFIYLIFKKTIKIFFYFIFQLQKRKKEKERKPSQTGDCYKQDS